MLSIVRCFNRVLTLFERISITLQYVFCVDSPTKHCLISAKNMVIFVICYWLMDTSYKFLTKNMDYYIGFQDMCKKGTFQETFCLASLQFHAVSLTEASGMVEKGTRLNKAVLPGTICLVQWAGKTL